MSIRIGDSFESNLGHTAKVIRYVNSKKITIQYPSGIEQVVQGSNLVRGRFRDPMQPVLYGVGVLGNDNFCYLDQSYVTWSNMLRRVLKPKKGTETAAYKDCTIIAEWFYFPNFRQWFDKQIFEKGYNLDKDILKKGNKVYSPDTCIFLPQELNKFIVNRSNHRGEWPLGVSFKTSNNKWDAKLSVDSRTVHLGLFSSPILAFNAYKIAKEAEAKRLAGLWKGRVDSRVIAALMDFKANIED